MMTKSSHKLIDRCTKVDKIRGFARILAALVFLTAGASKLYVLGTEFSIKIDENAEYFLKSFLAIVEFVVGWRLLSGHENRAIMSDWIIASFLWVLFVFVSTVQQLSGVVECECFGNFRLSQVAHIALLALLGGALAVVRPHFSNLEQSSVNNKSSGIRFYSSVAVVALLGSIALANPHLRHCLSLPISSVVFINCGNNTPCDVVNLGRVRPGDLVKKKLQLANLGTEDVLYIGGGRTCSCTTSTDLPAILKAGCSFDIELTYKAPSTIGSYENSLTYHLASQQKKLVLKLRSVVASQ